MTSLTMYDSWTAPTMLSMWGEPAPERGKVAHRVSNWIGVIDTSVRVFYPLVASGAVIFAALMWPAPDAAPPGPASVSSATPSPAPAPPR